jgi:hypothetical protein
MKRHSALSTVVLVGWLALLSVVNGDGAYDCLTHAPVGQSANDAQTGDRPPLTLIVGKKGDMTYTPSQPFPVKVSYSGGKVKSFLLTANPPSNTNTAPLGTFSVNTGPGLTHSCSSPNDALIGGSLGETGLINASWTPSATQSGYVEFKITVIDEEGNFWIWTSALTMQTGGGSLEFFHKID